jgi:hypothetical protein
VRAGLDAWRRGTSIAEPRGTRSQRVSFDLPSSRLDRHSDMSTPRILFPVTLLCLAPALLAAQRASRAPTGDLVVADILSTPDALLRVHDFGVGYSSPGLPILATPVDYLRGLAFDGPDSGYFVSGNSDSDGPTGFFRFENGQTSLVAPFPLVEWGSFADVAWSRRRDFLWYTWNPAGATLNTSLYRLDLDGTFTSVGELHYASGARIDSSGGIALDRTTGTLYGYDGSRAALVTIDPATASVTRIGSSALPGYPTVVIMSMDFSGDGRLFLVRNFGDLFEVDLATGSAVPAGKVDTFCSSLAFVPPRLLQRW